MENFDELLNECRKTAKEAVDEQKESKEVIEKKKLTAKLVMDIADRLATIVQPGKVPMIDIIQQVRNETGENFDEIRRFVRDTLVTKGWNISPMESKTSTEVDPEKQYQNLVEECRQVAKELVDEQEVNELEKLGPENYALPSSHPQVIGKEGRFPIQDDSHARAAIVVMQRSANISIEAKDPTPPWWWEGMYSELIEELEKSIKERYPKLDTSTLRSTRKEMVKLEKGVGESKTTSQDSREDFSNLLDKVTRETANESKVNETGEMSKEDIQPGGEDYEWAEAIRAEVLEIEKLTKGTLKFVEMKPFDKYQGPYAVVRIKGRPDTIWGSGEQEGGLYLESKDWTGTASLLANAIMGNEVSINTAKENSDKWRKESETTEEGKNPKQGDNEKTRIRKLKEWKEEERTILHIAWEGGEEVEDKLVKLAGGVVEDSYSTREANHLYLSFPSISKAQAASKKVEARCAGIIYTDIEESQEASEGKNPKSTDDEKTRTKKLKEEGDEKDTNLPPNPPEEVVEEPEAKPMEMRKEYLGKSEDTHYYFITKEGEEGGADDFLITDQEGVKRYSARDHNIEVSEDNIADFIIRAIQEVEILQIERSIFMKYILPKILSEEAPKEEVIKEPEEKKPEKKPVEEPKKEEPTKIPPPEEEEEELPRESKRVDEDYSYLVDKLKSISTTSEKKKLVEQESGDDLIDRIVSHAQEEVAKAKKETGDETYVLPFDALAEIIADHDTDLLNCVYAELNKRGVVTEKKNPPKCKKCGKAHWPFKKCEEAKEVDKRFRESEEIEEESDQAAKIKKLTRCPKCGKVKGKDEILCKKCFAEVMGESKKVTEGVGHISSMTDRELEKLGKLVLKLQNEYGVDISEDDAMELWRELEKRRIVVEESKKEVYKLSEMKVTNPEGITFDVHLLDDGTKDTVIDINGREFRFDVEFTSYWRDEEGVLSEEGLKELALDALANIEPEDYQELVVKAAGEEEKEELDIAQADSEDKIPGGLADKSKPEDFDSGQLKMGIEVEMEHTDDPKVAKEIAMDHLKEDPEYYTKLKKMEAGTKKQTEESKVNELEVTTVCKKCGLRWDKCACSPGGGKYKVKEEIDTTKMGDDELVAKIEELEVKHSYEPTSPSIENELNILRRVAKERGLEIGERKMKESKLEEKIEVGDTVEFVRDVHWKSGGDVFGWSKGKRVRVSKINDDGVEIDDPEAVLKHVVPKDSIKKVGESKLEERDWKYKIDLSFLKGVKEEDTKDTKYIKELGKRVGTVLHTFLATKRVPEDVKNDIEEVIDGFENIDDVEEFDDVMEELYDIGDANSIWVNTIFADGKTQESKVVENKRSKLIKVEESKVNEKYVPKVGEEVYFHGRSGKFVSAEDNFYIISFEDTGEEEAIDYDELLDNNSDWYEDDGVDESKVDKVEDKGDSMNKAKEPFSIEAIKANIVDRVNNMTEKKELLSLWNVLAENYVESPEVKDNKVVEDENATAGQKDAEKVAKQSASHHAKQDKTYTAKVDQTKPVGKEKEDADKIAKQSDTLHKKQDKAHSFSDPQLKQIKSSSESIEEKLFTKQFEDLAVGADFIHDSKRCVKHSETEYKVGEEIHRIEPKTEVEAIEKPRRENKEENVDEATEEDEELDILNDEVQDLMDEAIDSDDNLDEAKRKKMVGKKGRPLKKGAAVRSRGDCVYPHTHPKVTDNKDHFPINSENQARNALSRANQYKSAPKWFKGSLESLVKTVARKVKAKYPDIEVTKAAETPGKGPKETKLFVDKEVEDITERKSMERLQGLLGL